VFLSILVLSFAQSNDRKTREGKRDEGMKEETKKLERKSKGRCDVLLACFWITIDTEDILW
jgi:hypothetical protein